MRVHLACPHHHVITIINFIKQALYIFRGVLTIGIHEYQHLTLCVSCAGLDGGTITHGVNMRDNLDLVLSADINGVVS